MTKRLRRGIPALAAGMLFALSAAALVRAAPDDVRVRARQTARPADSGVPTTVTLAAPTVLTVGQVAGQLLVEVVDAAGLPVPDGTTVTLTVDDGELDPQQGSTAAGMLTATLTSSLTAGLVELTARAGDAEAVAEVEYHAAEPASAHLTAAGFARVGEPVAVSVHVADAYGNATGDGEVVIWASALGTADPTSSVVAAGAAATTIQNVVAGVDVVTATLDAVDLPSTATVTYQPGPAATLLVAVVPNRIAIGGQADVQITAADAYGNRALEDLSVLLNATGGEMAPGSVSLRQGYGTAVYRGGGSPGEYQVAATAAGIVGTAGVSLRPADLALEIGVRGPRGPLPETQVHPSEPVWLDLIVANGDLATAREVVVGVVVPDLMRPGRATANASIHERSSGPPGLVDEPPEDHTAYFWDLPDVAYGQSVTVSLPGSFDAARPWSGVDTFFVRAAANSRTVEASGSDLARGRAVSVHSTDLYLTGELDWDQSQLRPGGMAVFDIRYGNRLRATELRDVVITDTLPAGLVFDHWQPGLGTSGVTEAFPFRADSRELVWDVPGDFGAAGAIRLWLRIEESVLPESALTHEVAIGSDVLDVGPENNRSLASFALRGVNLVTSITAPPEAAAGDLVAYKIVVRNHSQQDPASSVKVTARPPLGARVVSFTAGGVAAGGTIAWAADSVGAGGQLSYDVVVQAPELAAIGTQLRLSATSASHEPDSLPADNDAEATTVIVAGPPSSAEMLPTGPARACGAVPVPLGLRMWDRHGNPARDGTAVAWSTTSGSVVDPSDTQAGQATALWWPGREPGPARLTAVAGDARAEQPVEVAPSELAALAVTLRPRIAPASGQVQVTVNALDGCSQPAADGVPVTVSAQRGSFGAGGPQITMQTRNGRVVATLNVGPTLGPLRLRAESGDVAGESIVSVVPPGEEPPDEFPPPTLWLPFVMGRQGR